MQTPEQPLCQRRVLTPEQKERKRLWEKHHRVLTPEQRERKRELSRERMRTLRALLPPKPKKDRFPWDKIWGHYMVERRIENQRLAGIDNLWCKHPAYLRWYGLAAYYRNHDKYKADMRDRAKARYHNLIKNDPAYTIKHILRNCIARVCRKYKTSKFRKTIEYLGCTIGEARSAIESRFRPGMNWHNHGSVWEVDHIRPMSSFNYNDHSQLMLVNHISNLQPLFKHENRSKAALWN